MEFLLVEALNSQDNSRELQFMEISYADDVDVGTVNCPAGNFESATEGR